MRVDMVMPQMGESIAEATISKWLVKPGDKVEKDQTILEISTDKVDSEIPSPASGVVAEVLFKEGDVVPVKVKIAVIDTEASAKAAGKASAAPAPSATPAPSPKVETKTASHVNGSERPSAPRNEPAPTSAKFISPLVKSLAEKHGVPLSELDALSGSGQGGRVNKQDLLGYIESRKSSGSSRPQATAQASQAKAPPPPAPTWNEDDVSIVPMDNMRQAIAEHMVRSKATSPHVYSVQEIDMTNISKWRAKYKNAFQEREGFSLSFTPFFLEAAVRGLQRYPYVNASVDGKKIILKKHINLGCAVALENAGLIVPVIKNAEEKNFVGIARGLNDLALRARTKKLSPDDVMGGTFTVTNPGVFGTMIGNPIINQPQVAILCLGAIKKRPVVIEDMIGIREMCYLTLSYDHRIIDGSLSGQFLAFLREYLEGWDMNRTPW